MDFDKIKCTAHLVSVIFWNWTGKAISSVTGYTPYCCARNGYKSFKKLYAILAKHNANDKELTAVYTELVRLAKECGLD